MSDVLEAHGIRVGVPRGWEAELGTMEDGSRAGGLGTMEDGSRAGGLSASSASHPRVLLHLANFVLPTERGDYGSGAVEIMDRGGILIVLMEFDRSSTSTALFAAGGIPHDLDVADFSGDSLQRRLPGQAGTQQFFHVGDRAFVVYVVLGSGRAAGLLVPEVNRMLNLLSIL